MICLRYTGLQLRQRAIADESDGGLNIPEARPLDTARIGNRQRWVSFLLNILNTGWLHIHKRAAYAIRVCNQMQRPPVGKAGCASVSLQIDIATGLAYTHLRGSLYQRGSPRCTQVVVRFIASKTCDAE